MTHRPPWRRIPVLPLPYAVSHPAAFAAIALLHVYLGGGHLIHLASGEILWEHIWKGGGAMLGAYYFLALATRQRASMRMDAVTVAEDFDVLR